MGQYLAHLCGLRRDLSKVARPEKTLVRLTIVPGYTGLFDRHYAYRPGSEAGTGRGGRRQEGVRAMRVSRSLVHRCRTEGCEALVDYNSACQWAARCGRDNFEPGDGCSSRSCCRKFNKKLHRKRQQERCADVLAGRKLLLCRTKRRTCNLAYLCSDGWTQRATARALAAVE